MRKNLSFTAALLIALTACGPAEEPMAIVTDPIATPPVEAQAQSSSATSSVAEVASEIDTDEFSDVSIRALRNKTFDGRDLKLGAVLADTAAYTRYTITYMSGDLKISGIMNIPKGQGPFPVLILNHGHIDTSIYTNGRGLKREQDYLAKQGYVVLHPDFRNHAFSDKAPDTDATFRLGYAEDSINAIYALQAAKMPNVDASRVGMMGHSMGGGVTLVALVAVPDLIDAAMLYAPVSGDARLNYERWTTRRPERAKEMRERYGSPEENPEFWDNVSAISFLDRITAPIAIHHGTADTSVPYEWSEDLEKRLKAIGKEVTLYLYPGAPHEFIRDWETVMERTTEFFDAAVKN